MPSVLVCPWLFVASSQAVTLFVNVFGAVLGPMFGIMVADYYLVKRQVIRVEDLYTMSPEVAFHYDGGWGWLIGTAPGAMTYRVLAGQGSPAVAFRPGGMTCTACKPRAGLAIAKPPCGKVRRALGAEREGEQLCRR